MKDAKRVAIWGMTGSGKSTLARELAAEFSHVIALDPAGDWGLEPGWKPVTTIAQVEHAISEGLATGFKIAWRPTFSTGQALEGLSRALMQVQEPYRTGSTSRKICLMIDEMAEAYSSSDQQRADREGFRQLILQGRHYGVEIVGISQRPQDVGARFRDQAAVTYCFALPYANARQPIAQMIGKKADDLMKLERGQYIRIEGLVIQNGETKHPGAKPAPKPRTKTATKARPRAKTVKKKVAAKA